MDEFNIIDYLEGLTNFVFTKAVLKRVAIERKVSTVTSYEELTDRDKDLLLADLLFVIYTSPNYTASFTKQHGAYTVTVGSQRYDTKREIYNVMIGLYAKWEDDKINYLKANKTVWVLEDDCI